MLVSGVQYSDSATPPCHPGVQSVIHLNQTPLSKNSRGASCHIAAWKCALGVVKHPEFLGSDPEYYITLNYRLS